MRTPVSPPWPCWHSVAAACSGGLRRPSTGTGCPRSHRHITSLHRRRGRRARTDAVGGVTYADSGVNPFTDPVEDRLSTFGLDVDTASYTIAQRYVDDGTARPRQRPRRGVGQRASTRGTACPRTRRSRSSRTVVQPFPDRDEVLLRIGLQARDVRDRAARTHR